MLSAKLASSAHLTKRILVRLDGATGDQAVAGLQWYAEARQTVDSMATLGGLTREQVAGIMAALSPQTRWEQNIAGTLRVVAARRARKRLPTGVTLYPTNARKAWKIATGSSPEAILSGKKVIPFFKNLCGDESAVTVDTWIWKNSGMSGTLTNSRNRAIVRAYRVAAKRRGITPAQAQAIDWVVVRGRAN